MKRACAVAVVLMVLAAGMCQAAGLELFVATGGSDDNPGTRKAPFASLTAARDSVRAVNAGDGLPEGGVTVWLRGGAYSLTESLQLGPEDSGTEATPVTWQAWGKEKVWLNGGQTVDAADFRPITDEAINARLDPGARGNVMQLDVDRLGIEYLEQLPESFLGFTGEYPVMLEVFCNGERMQLARWPNEGFSHFDEIVDSGSGLRDRTGPERSGIISYEGDRPSRWDMEEGVWLLGYWARAYVCEVARIASIDTDARQMTFANSMHYGLDTWGAKRFFAMNILEELDRPGEWFLDRERGRLYFWPPAALGKSEISISVVADPMVVMQDASWITLRGVGLEGGRLDAVSIRGGDHNRVVACTIRNVGRHAVDIAGGTDHGVVGCDIHHVGYGGVLMDGGDRETLTPCNHYAVNNHIHHTSVIRRTHAGALSLRGVGCRAAHNLIHHEPHSAVWYRGNDHIMEYNEIYWAHIETSEGGVFYTGRDWTYRGNVIRYNYIHHINDSLEGSPTSVNIVHLDDCVSGTTFMGNLCYRCGRGVSVCGGPDNIVDNNIFIECNPGVGLSARGLQWYTWHRREDGTVYAIDTRSGEESTTMLRSLEKVPYQQAPWTNYPHLADMLSPERDPVGAPWFSTITRNIGVGGRLMTVSNQVEDHWVTIENNWDEGDPGFVDFEGGDFRLRADAPALERIGFEPLPVEKMGLMNDGTRATWPVRPEPPPADFKPRWLIQQEQETKMPTALPVLVVKATSADITIDGVINPDEWAPGQAGGVMVEGYRPAELKWTATGEAAALPSLAWIETDAEALYLGFDNQLNPEHGVSGGHKWGVDDAVEIALAVTENNEVGPIMVLRGYSDGHLESSNEAGAPGSLVKSVLEGVQYACAVQSKKRWTAEWRIPFTSLGVEPARENPRILFNLSVRKPGDDLWVTWKQPGGYTWDVHQGGFLWLSAFGDVTLNAGIPSQARIDVRSGTEGLVFKALKGCEVATWAEPIGARLSGSSDDLKADWRTFTYSFEASADGVAIVELMGRGLISPVINDHVPVWTYWDNFTCKGAELLNGGFEQVGDDGGPSGWTSGLRGGLLVTDAKVAFAGDRCAKTWHNGRFVQKLQAKAGVPVIITARVRGEMVD